MCKPASGVLTKDKVHWSKKSESHEAIIAEHQLHADGVNGPNILCFEIVPPNGDFQLPSDQWEYRIDQDELPKWHDAKRDEERARSMLPEWLAAKVVLPDQSAECVNRQIVAVYGTVRACGSATVEAYGSATVEAYGSATVEAYDLATVEAYGSAAVWAYDSATVRAHDSATVEAHDLSTVEAHDLSTVEAHDSATVRACGSATVDAYGSATVEAYDSTTVRACGSDTVWAYDSATVEAYGSATVRAHDLATVWAYDSAAVRAHGSATVLGYTALPRSILKSPSAILVDRSDPDKVRCYHGRRQTKQS